VVVGILAALNGRKLSNAWQDFWSPQASPIAAVGLSTSDSGAVSQSHATQGSPAPDSSELTPVSLPEADTATTQRHLLTPFLRGNELWMHDSNTNKDSLIVKDTLGIDNLILSPHRRYVAIQWITQWVGMDGEWDDSTKAPQEPIHNVSIYDCESGRMVRNIDLRHETFLGMDKWYSNSRIVLGSASDFELIGYYLYDAYRDSLQAMPQDFRP
jgi:hypothetical protein